MLTDDELRGLVRRLRNLDRSSVQSVIGSRVFAEAADALDAYGAEVLRLRGELQQAENHRTMLIGQQVADAERITARIALADENKRLRAMLPAAYLAGFMASGEGWNGEWPFQDSATAPESDSDWLAVRDADLAALKGGAA